MGIRRKLNIPWEMLPVILALAWPTMLEQLLQTAVQYIDTAMVGSLGTQATAAVGTTTTVNWLINSTISALGIGFLAYISQAHGAGEQDKISRASGQAVLAVIVCGLLFTVLTLGLSSKIPVWMQADEQIRPLAAQYFFILYLPMLPRTATIIFGTVLRAMGDTRTPMRAGILVNILNVVLNFFMIYPTRTVGILGLSVWIPGAGMGVVGAATASAVAFVAGGIYITVAYFRHPDLRPKQGMVRPDWQVLRPCLKVALPNAVQRFCTSLGYVAFASMINALGDISTAANTIANTVESAFYIPGYGMQSATATLSGNALGANDIKRIRRLIRMTVVIEAMLMLISGTLLFAFAPAMMSLFTKDAQVILLGVMVLRMVAVSEPFYGVSIVLEGMMQGLGRTFAPFVCNVIGMWGIRIVGTYLCTVRLGMGLVSAWACMILHNLCLFAMFVSYYATGKWNIPKQKIQ